MRIPRPCKLTAPAAPELSERGIHVDRDNPSNGWLIERGKDGMFTALEYGRLDALLSKAGGK